MGFDKFGLQLAIRIVLITAILAVVAILFSSPGQYAATLLAVIVALLLTAEVFKFVSKTNREVARFLDAVRYADFGQRFKFSSLDGGFKELGDTFTHILERFREDREQNERELRHLKALLEHVPVPLFSVHANGSVTLWNNSSRRLFGNIQASRVEDLDQFGEAFHHAVESIVPGKRTLAAFEIDGIDQQVTISASEIVVATATERLISVQNIQSELDGMQSTAWQDLVRVLTHEIMNSITPVSSLAKTAVDMVDDIKSDALDVESVQELQDVRKAVDAVARRSDGLLNFVASYQQLTRLPAPHQSRFQISDLFADVARMATIDWLDNGLALLTNVEPDSLDLVADKQMIEQVLINLLNNSEHALEDVAHGQVTLSARLNQRGHVTLEVSDNGPGIPPDVARNIFVPFYTTRSGGSGVGLALSRQIMLAHSGTISFTNREGGGARFALVF